MKVFYPSYYKKFKCIADRCCHSCCVGWEICVDNDTLKKYSRIEGDLCSHIDPHTGIIKLCDNGRCPFLLENGLCRIISDFGEEYISQICREHPRFYHRIKSAVECGIGMSCEEAARVILSSDGYDDFFFAESEEAEWADESDFDTIVHREKIYRILAQRELSLDKRFEKIRKEYLLTESIHTANEWNEILSNLEYLDIGHKDVLKLGRQDDRADIEIYLERFFAYLVFRHLSIATGYDNLRARLEFCFLLVSVLKNNVATIDNDISSISDIARIISEEIEYSSDNTDELIFEIESELM